eukprot:m.253058 g.253058  ORF g.253058 m.253058 type:complete len:592 (+) comp40364_c2_seq4:97-1872(+)
MSGSNSEASVNDPRLAYAGPGARRGGNRPSGSATGFSRQSQDLLKIAEGTACTQIDEIVIYQDQFCQNLKLRNFAKELKEKEQFIRVLEKDIDSVETDVATCKHFLILLDNPDDFKESEKHLSFLEGLFEAREISLALISFTKDPPNRISLRNVPTLEMPVDQTNINFERLCQLLQVALLKDSSLILKTQSPALVDFLETENEQSDREEMRLEVVRTVNICNSTLYHMFTRVTCATRSCKLLAWFFVCIQLISIGCHFWHPLKELAFFKVLAPMAYQIGLRLILTTFCFNRMCNVSQNPDENNLATIKLKEEAVGAFENVIASSLKNEGEMSKIGRNNMARHLENTFSKIANKLSYCTVVNCFLVPLQLFVVTKLEFNEEDPSRFYRNICDLLAFALALLVVDLPITAYIYELKLTVYEKKLRDQGKEYLSEHAEKLLKRWSGINLMSYGLIVALLVMFCLSSDALTRTAFSNLEEEEIRELRLFLIPFEFLAFFRLCPATNVAIGLQFINFIGTILLMALFSVQSKFKTDYLQVLTVHIVIARLLSFLILMPLFRVVTKDYKAVLEQKCILNLICAATLIFVWFHSLSCM